MSSVTDRKEEASEIVRSHLASIYPNDVPQLHALCVHRINYPLGFEHPKALAQMFDANINNEAFEELRLGYVYLCAYYFLLDATVDEHLSEKNAPLYLTHLLSASCSLFTNACLKSRPEALSDTHRLLFEHISQNANAIKLEILLNDTPLKDTPDQNYKSIIGRSNAVMFLYSILSFLSNKSTDEQIVSILNDIVYYIQLGDDLGDWRKDYDGKRWTPFLRACFRRKGRLLNIQELEEEIHLTGFYEEYMANVINGLGEAKERLEKLSNINCCLLLKLINSHRNGFLDALSDLVALKFSVAANQR